MKFRIAPIALLLLAPAAVYAQAPARQSGTVKAVQATSLTVTTAAGDVAIAVPAGTPVLQSADLKTTSPSSMDNVAVGDRVLVSTKPGDPATAARVIVIKSGDIAARNAAQTADWQRRGTSGIVKSVDGSVVTVAVGARMVKVDTTPKTVFRRYADDSVKFQDAKTATLAQIAPGDQLSVRGDKSADGSTIEAEEVVAGSFENLSGLLMAVDAAAGTLTLKDLATKKTVTVKVTANSDLRNLPPQAAAMFAARSRGGAGTGAAGSGAAGTPGSGGYGAGGRPGSGTGAGGGSGAGGGENAGRARSAGMDLSRMLARLPTQTVAELHAGEAVMIVASSGGGSGPTAITLLSGVEPILSASPTGADAITLSPWNLSAPDAGGGAGAGGGGGR